MIAKPCASTAAAILAAAFLVALPGWAAPAGLAASSPAAVSAAAPTAAPAAALVQANPKAVAELKAHQRTDANAAWWGFDPRDATDALQAALDSGAKTLLVPNMHHPWIVRPLHLPNNMDITFAPGVEIVAKPHAFVGKGDCLFTARDVKNLTLRGSGAVWRMQKPEYTHGEWRHALSLLSCTNVKIVGLTLKDSGGDGIYVGHDRAGPPACRNVLISHVTCDNNRRQGISVISARNLVIEGSAFINTQGTAPQAGIDFEPNHADEQLVCTVRNCRFENNRGCGITIYAAQLNASSDDVDIRIVNCQVSGSGRAAMAVSGFRKDGPGGTIRFENCTARYDPAAGALAIGDKDAAGPKVIFSGCTWKLTPNSWKYPKAQGPRDAIIFAVSSRRRVSAFGGIELDNCRIEDSRPLPILRLIHSRGAGAVWKDIRGQLTVVGAPGGQAKVALGGARIDLEVKAAAKRR